MQDLAEDSVQDRGAAVQEVAQDLARVQVVESQAALGSARDQEAVPAAERALFPASSLG